MKKCKLCGGSCLSIGNGQYQCDCCGGTFSEDDFAGEASKPSVRAEGVKYVDKGAEIFEKTVNGVCEISAATGSRGSGYLISQNGYIITNYHVIAMNNGSVCGQLNVKIAGETVSANAVSTAAKDRADFCSNADLALIKLSKIPFGAKALKFGDYSRVRTGETVFVIGNSLGRGTCITKGIVSDRARNGQILTDCPVNPGNSGGPIFNADGEIIGTIVASGNRSDGSDAEGMNYAIPASSVIEFLKKNGIRI